MVHDNVFSLLLRIGLLSFQVSGRLPDGRRAFQVSGKKSRGKGYNVGRRKFYLKPETWARRL